MAQILQCFVSYYVLEMKNFGLKLEPTRDAWKPWNIVCFGEKDFSGDPIRKKAISGFIYVLSTPLSWQSKVQRSITLSSSEAKC